MRQIKFRGKRLYSGEWVYGSLIQRIDSTEIFDGVFTWVVDPSTVGQFTGLLDKNGEEIYEGDVFQMWLKDSVEPNGGQWHRMYVVFSAEKGFVSWGERMTIEDAEPLYEMLQWEQCEIIGSIHDNPELLKTE